MHDTGTDLGYKIEKSIRSDSNNRGDFETKNQHGEQEDAASQPGHANERPYYNADQNLNRDFHARVVETCRGSLSELSGYSIHSNESLAFQVQNDLLSGFLGGQIGSVDDDLGILGFFIRIRNA